ncbi:heterogeneous nuclear ribonucleoprotein A3-like isoform X1 [Lytechinus variegatus]|uniref:heterogeneous nuclear ribonucleoprotein A3-like isoform X1 n=1 Tax=Lytechinus variegatus TaxID=7654 RepID=UPI001BB26251|nr:heterogeneous nuclear ribonucleoprotein A3-like isoform X1 [Lytechinus variegatus]
MNIVLNPPTNIGKRMGEEVGKIFVGGVNRETTIDAFRAYFESFGKINDIVLMMDKDNNNGMNKGYGFVKYDDPRCADDVILKKGQHKLDGKELDTKPCNARGSRPRGGIPDDNRTKKIFVGGISQQAGKQDLYDVFKPFGMVEDVHIMTDNATGKHRGFGFVTLDSEEAVEKLVQIRHLELKGKSMEIKKAQPKMNRGFGGPGGPGGPMGGGGGGFPQGGGSWNQGGQPGFGGFGGGSQWNMGQPMGQFGQQQQGGFQQRGGPGQGYGSQQQGYNNGYRQQGQGGPQYGQQGGGYAGQQQQQQPQQQHNYGGKPSAGGDNYGTKNPRLGGQGYSNYGGGGYGQSQQDPYGQQQQQQQQYGNQGSMGNYPQEASGYGPQRVNYNQQQQGYNQGQFGNDMPGQNFGPPQQQQQPPPPQPPQQQQPPQGYGQPVEGGPDMYGNNNYGRGNLGGGNQFHPYRRFQGNQVQ